MSDTVTKLLAKAQSKQIEVKRSKPSLKTNFFYNIVIHEPETNKVVVAMGSQAGDDYTWGVEVQADEINKFLTQE
jgi:hypothetical protein